MKKKLSIVKKEQPRPAVLDRVALLSEIKDNSAYGIASKLLSEVKDAQRKVEAEKARVVAPLNEALKAERSRWKPIESALEVAESRIKGQMIEFINEQERKKKKIEADQRITKSSTLSKKVEEVAVNKVEEVQVRKIKVLEIFEESLVPIKYREINEQMVRAALNSGQEVPGCRMVEQTSLAAF